MHELYLGYFLFVFIPENDGHNIKDKLSKSVQVPNKTIMNDAEIQSGCIRIFGVCFDPDVINVGSLFRPKYLSLEKHFQSKSQTKRFRRQSALAIAIAAALAGINNIGIGDPGNLQGPPLALGVGGFIFGGPAALGAFQGPGFSIYDTNLGIFPFINPAPVQAPSPTPTPTTTTNAGATKIG